MNCAEVGDLLYAFVDGELTVEQNVALLKHSELCTSCAANLRRERDLRALVDRTAREPAGPRGLELMAAALDRVEAEEAAFAEDEGQDPAAPAAPAQGRLLRWFLRAGVASAAALLIAVGVSAALPADPLCLRGCPTVRLAQAAARAAEGEEALPLDQLQADFPRPLFVPRACGISVVGGHLIAAAGAPPRPVLELRCQHSGQRIVLLHVPEGHSHFWQEHTLPDGRVYLEARTPDGLRLVGWRANGGVYVCVTEREVRSGVLAAMAAAVRDAAG